MTFRPPTTRRDVVTLVIYIVLAYNVLNPLLQLVLRFALTRVSWLQTPLVSERYWESTMRLGVAIVFSLAFIPFVSLVAAGATGRKSEEPVTRLSFSSLISTCAGLMLFLTSLPQFGSAICYYLLASNFYGGSAASVRPYLLRGIASTLVALSFGFMLAFFSAIFDGCVSVFRTKKP